MYLYCLSAEKSNAVLFWDKVSHSRHIACLCAGWLVFLMDHTVWKNLEAGTDEPFSGETRPRPSDRQASASLTRGWLPPGRHLLVTGTHARLSGATSSRRAQGRPPHQSQSTRAVL